jgi:hypothetical protein
MKCETISNEIKLYKMNVFLANFKFAVCFKRSFHLFVNSLSFLPFLYLAENINKKIIILNETLNEAQ